MHVVLLHPQIPQNTGNIGRTCVAVQARLWLVEPLGFRLDQHHLRRAGLDYWQYLNWDVVPSWQVLVDRLSGHRFWFFSRHARRHFTTPQFRSDDVLVFGSETDGLPPSVLNEENADQRLRIPMAPGARSLNLACAVAVACYEVVRQCPLTNE
jgi:tRNA (cytidine/uridine-2'-O-)-methyltransferase